MPIGKKPEAAPAPAASTAKTAPAKSTGAPPKVAAPTVKTAAAGGKPAAPAANPPSTAPKSAALNPLADEYYKKGIAYFDMAMKHMGDGKLHLSVVQGGKTEEKAAAAPVTQAKPTIPAKGASPKSSPTARSAPAPAAAKTPASSPSEASAGDGDPDTMNRAQLLNLCKTLGVPFDEYNGKKREDLLAIAKAHIGGEASKPAAEEGYDEVTQQKADIVSDLLGENYATFEAYSKPGVPKAEQPEGYLGCGGDCQNCPNPDAFPTASEQVAACYKNLHENLGIEPELPL